MTDLTIGEAAAILGFSPGYTRKLAERGKLDADLVEPRLWVVTRESVDRYKATPHPSGPKRKIATVNSEFTKE